MHTEIEQKIQKYRSKLENAPYNILYSQKLSIYEDMIGGGCDVNKDGTYVFFINKNDALIKDLTLNQMSAFNKISSYLPGFRMKISGDELKFNECAKPDLEFCIIPPSNLTHLFKSVPSVQYTSVANLSIDKAKTDIINYEAKKQAELDAAKNEIDTIKNQLSIYKDQRLAAIESCGIIVNYLKEMLAKQKSFNLLLKPFFGSKIGSSDSKKIEPLKSFDLNACVSKMEHIKLSLSSANPSAYAQIKDIVDGLDMVVVITAASVIKSGATNKVVAIYDIKEKQQLFPNNNMV
ncbi:hypothetical protein BMW23_0209 [Bodo saltans virus]|uniref:Uncharacterized protein n=1 Tax=Bodo saltans virus TaxID=2024608 RepID=A0A2H4UTT7_9VIRU|nr:hypothetical protein QJ851_gp0204 [Bodo saltans virus]ATZ80267.1 hypothetical protein BMW23_0209 [Bodo saltans virus]